MRLTAIELEATLAHRSGRKLITLLLEELGLWTPVYSPEPMVMAGIAKCHDVALDLSLQIQTLLPGSWAAMIKERFEDQKIEEARHKKLKKSGDDDQ